MSIINEAESVTDVLAVSIERGAAMVGGVSTRRFREELDFNGGPIRTVRMGNRVLIPVESLREYLKAPAVAKPAETNTSQSGGLVARNEKKPRRRSK
jgi:hypothetical protein